IETEYHQRLRDFMFEKQKNEIIKEIKNIFPAPTQPTNQKAVQMRALQIKAMKEIIIERVDESRYNIVAPNGLRLPNGLFNMDRVRAFARTIANDVVAAVERRNDPQAGGGFQAQPGRDARARRQSHWGSAHNSRAASG
ncbi:unnamed protein product, partial [Fusarium langsethiae]